MAGVNRMILTCHQPLGVYISYILRARFIIQTLLVLILILSPVSIYFRLQVQVI